MTVCPDRLFCEHAEKQGCRNIGKLSSMLISKCTTRMPKQPLGGSCQILCLFVQVELMKQKGIRQEKLERKNSKTSNVISLVRIGYCFFGNEGHCDQVIHHRLQIDVFRQFFRQESASVGKHCKRMPFLERFFVNT